ncbi:fibrinogen-like protein 1 [Watersipora subatra]|uniref:fibrinogen-like protein 1 n=1 Tax=Watersipora subatra TaxID=2589382 RepID=UPI00355C9821
MDELYDIIRDVSQDLLTNHNSFEAAGSFSLSYCVNLCTASSICLSAVRISASGECHLFSSTLHAHATGTETGLTYIGKRKPGAAQSATEMKGFCGTEESSTCNTAPSPRVYQGCQDAFDNGERNSEAVYTLHTDPESAPVLAVCQFDDQSGWTVIQRRLDGTIDFNRGWDDYAHGFGNTNGEHWIGLENIHHLTKKDQKLSIFLEDHEGQSRTANYSFFQVENRESNYQLLVSGYNGDAGDSLSYHHKMGFSTLDYDNDGSSGSCGSTYRAGWWYDNCLKANLNGVWHNAENAQQSQSGVAWLDWKHPYSFKTVYMRVGN